MIVFASRAFVWIRVVSHLICDSLAYQEEEGCLSRSHTTPVPASLFCETSLGHSRTNQRFRFVSLRLPYVSVELRLATSRILHASTVLRRSCAPTLPLSFPRIFAQFHFLTPPLSYSADSSPSNIPTFMSIRYRVCVHSRMANSQCCYHIRFFSILRDTHVGSFRRGNYCS